MIFNFVAFKRRAPQSLRSPILSVILISFLVNSGFAQTRLSREQFSRLNLAARANLFENEILRAAQAEGVDPNILWTVAYLETRFRPYLTSPKNARGLMQFIPATAARFGLENPYESISAIRAAARYVKVLSNLFGGRIDSILAAYNSGEGTVLAFLSGRTIRTERKIINPGRIRTIGGVPPYSETIQYVGRGLKIYRWLILRGVFTGTVSRAIFPSRISQAVARAQVFDPELGKVSNFKNLANYPKAQINRSGTVNNAIDKTKNRDERQNSEALNLMEVYYDSRSGNRYRINNGKKEKLGDSGLIVISNNSRPETTNSARSTFFAAPPNK